MKTKTTPKDWRGQIREGRRVMEDSYIIFGRFPEFLVPIFAVWLIYAPTILYFTYFFNWYTFTLTQNLVIVFGIIFFWAFLLSLSCSVLLEMIEQSESNIPTSLPAAVGHTLKFNTLKMIPIVFLWTAIWFFLALIEALLSKAKRHQEEFSAENAAKTLADYKTFSWSGLFIEALQKGIRMVVFLILPAIAWEKKGPIDALKKGFVVLKTNFAGFVTAFTLSYFAAILVFAIPGIIFYFASEMKMEIPMWLWVVLIIYIGFGWSYIIYLEQLFGAELYLWHMKWEKAVKQARANNQPLPSISEIEKPSILDAIYEFGNRR